jgi:ParB family transcriptional regulator, chromosome partitioning protein
MEPMSASKRTTGKRIARSVTSRDGDSHIAGGGELQHIPLAKIDEPASPPRRLMGDLAALAESMQEYGLQQPISVRSTGERFVLTSGLRRLTAAKMLAWVTIPAFVRDLNANDAYLLDLIENLQRQDLRPEEEADAFQELIRVRRWSVRQLAKAIKRSAAYVSKRVRVFDDVMLRRAILERGLAVSTAEELLAAAPDLRETLLERAIEERWDQTRARQELQMPVLAALEVLAERVAHERQQTPLLTGRPPGLTRAIREFHQLIERLEPGQMNEADRSAFRSLYRDLTMLARAPTTPRQRVFPPLPGGTATEVRGPSETRTHTA